MTDDVTYNANLFGVEAYNSDGEFFQIYNDGSLIHYSVSQDGQTWLDLGAESATSGTLGGAPTQSV